MLRSLSRASALTALAFFAGPVLAGGAAPVPDVAAPQQEAEPEPVLPPCIHGDDNFGLGCCTEPAPSYPNFPEVQSIGKYACLSDCGLSEEHFVNVKLGKPAFTLCDTAEMEISVTPIFAPGIPPIAGKLTAKYSRTWQLTGSGIQQIWRFVINGDLEYATSSADLSPCPVPPPDANASFEAPIRHHFFGHVDYVCDPSQSHVELLLDSMSLSHLPGCISHAPGTARPRTGAAAHYRNSYHIVAPSNFVFGGGSGAIPGGAVAGDAVRESFLGGCFPSTYSCVGEARVLGGEYFSANCDVCLCSSFPCEGPWRHYGMSIPVLCNNQQQILTGAPGVYPVAPEGLVGQGLGAWVGGSAPLGSTDLVVKWGAVRIGKPCQGEKARDHTVFGVATKSVDGSKPQLFQPTGLAPDWFIDMVNSLTRQPSPNPPCQSLKDQFGAPAFSDLAIQLNT